MAEELNVIAKMVYNPSAAGISSIAVGEHDRLFDVVGDRYVFGTQRVTEREEIEPNKQLNKIGYCFFSNIGNDDIYIVIRGQRVLKIKPGEFQVVRPDQDPSVEPEEGTTGYIEYFMLEN